MQRPWCFVLLLLMPYVSGCQPQRETEGVTLGNLQTGPAVLQERDKNRRSSLEITDVLDALQLNIWKDRVNDDGSERIRKVSLCIKPKEMDPKTVLALDLPDEEPGTLLVFLQDVGDRRVKLGIVYHGDNGRGGSRWNVADDPFADVAGVAATTSVGGIARVGNIVLKSSGTPGGADIARRDSVAIFVKNESK